MDIFAHLFLQILDELDRSRRPIREVVPDIDRLRADPLGVLLATRIVIGPARMVGSMFLFTMFLIASFCIGGWLVGEGLNELFSSLRVPKPVRDIVTPLPALVGLASPFLAVFLANRLLRRHWIALTPTGFQVWQGGVHLFCPWDLLQGSEEVLRYGRNSARLAIHPTGIPFVTLSRSGRVVATGRAARIGSCRIQDSGFIVLNNRFQAPSMEVARLLRDIANRLKAADS